MRTTEKHDLSEFRQITLAQWTVKFMKKYGNQIEHFKKLR